MYKDKNNADGDGFPIPNFRYLGFTEKTLKKITYMSGNQTFTMIKPVAVKNNNTGAILKMINDAGFRIKAMKFTHLTKQQASDFYAVHAGKSF